MPLWPAVGFLTAHAWRSRIVTLYRSRESDNIAAKAVALLRHGFGDHPLHKQGNG